MDLSEREKMEIAQLLALDGSQFECDRDNVQMMDLELDKTQHLSDKERDEIAELFRIDGSQFIADPQPTVDLSESEKIEIEQLLALDGSQFECDNDNVQKMDLELDKTQYLSDKERDEIAELFRIDGSQFIPDPQPTDVSVPKRGGGELTSTDAAFDETPNAETSPSKMDVSESSNGQAVASTSAGAGNSSNRKKYFCTNCNVSFTVKRNLDRHKCSDITSVPSDRVIVETTTTAIEGFFTVISGSVPYKGDSAGFLDNVVKDRVRIRLLRELHNGPVKCNFQINVEFKRNVGKSEQYLTTGFDGKMTIILNGRQFNAFWEDQRAIILEKIANFICKGSGWVEFSVQKYKIKLCKYTPLEGSSFIELPTYLKNKQAIINVQNDDPKCFLWSILSAIHKIDSTNHPERVNHYEPFENTLNMTGIPYPVSLKGIKKFEKLNKIPVNVFGFSSVNNNNNLKKKKKKKNAKKIFPMQLTKLEGEPINLMLIVGKNNTHYCWIKDFERLLFDVTDHEHKVFYCMRCLHRFSSERTRLEHKKMCEVHKATRIELPTPGEDDFVEFKNFHYELKCPYVIYADFECLLEPVACTSTSNTTPLSYHIPSSFAYVIINENGEVDRCVSYIDRDGLGNSGELFLRCLKDESERLKPKLKGKKPMVFTTEDEENFDLAVDCHICSKPLGEDRVRDHCHFSGKFRGASHNKCNLKYQPPKHIPVFFHNLKYDSKLILPALGLPGLKERVSVIPRTMENYVGFHWGAFRFLDSMSFLPSSLETLVQNLAAGAPSQSNFPITFSSEELIFNLMVKKGIFPYEYLTSHTKFSDEQLPPISEFYSKLKQEGISDADYAHAQAVWNEHGIKDLGEYQLLYNKSDVYLLADIFENFRKLSLQWYKIDPCHVYTAPGLSWEACLRMTGVRLGLITDIDQHLFIERAIRGGVSMISHREATANNSYIPETFDPSQDVSHILYLDCNNLYGTQMARTLPSGNLRWEPNPELLDVTSIDDDGPTGYFLEVDLEYNQSLHDHHNDYPLAPEHLEITNSMLSPYCKDIMERFKLKTSKVKKLVPNLGDKEKYVVHYRTLKLYVELGLKIKKIYKALAFDQSKWLKPFIDFNTLQRMLATTPAAKDFFKLIINSYFGKTMENLRGRIDVEIITNEQRGKSVINDPRLNDFLVVNKDVVVVNRLKVCVKFNRPIYVGACILDGSKEIMYRFHYNYVLNKYGPNAKLLFTDTDSLTYWIKTLDVYEDMYSDLNQWFDTSDYPVSHKLYSLNNKKALGKFKDEMHGIPIKQFLGLRAKMYSLLADDEEHNKKVGKGISKVILKKYINHQNYIDALNINENSIQREIMYFIRNFHHKLSTIEQEKVTLSPYDDKRYILPDGVTTLAHFHYKTGIPRLPTI